MSREPVYDVLNALARTMMAAQGLRISITGQENIPKTGGAVLAANHTGYLDFVEVGLVGRNSGRNVRYMMKAELERNRLVAFLMRHCQAIAVDRSAGAGAYAKAVDALRDGELVVVYPEATISRSFELKEFKSGAARMALDSGAPIIPIAIWGAHRVWTKGCPKRLGRHHFSVNIHVGAPIQPGGHDTSGLTAALRGELTQLLESAQDGYPMERGAYWVPARFGGSAPTPEEAKQLD